MLYLLRMTVAGSTMFFLYFVVSRLLKNLWLSRQRYFLLKIVLVYFVVPLAPLRETYTYIFSRLINPWYRRVITERLQQQISRTGNVLIRNPIGITYPNLRMAIQVGIFLIFLSVATIVLILRIRRYLQLRKKVHQQIRLFNPPSSEIYQMLETLKTEYRIKRKVELCLLPDAMHCTMGVFQPVIILGELPKDNRELELILRHELIHIKKNDFLFRIMMEFVICLHWFNPLKILLEREFEQVMELDCDERVMWHADYEERQFYARLLINQTGSIAVGKWASSLAKNNTRKRERVETIMNKKIPNKIVIAATALLMGVIICSNSLNAFAYHDVNLAETNSSECEEINDSGIELFVPNVNDDGLFFNEEVIYDEQFTDVNGNVYPIPEDIIPYRYCRHEFIQGTIQRHYPHLDGSCTVKVYDGQRCGICGYIIYGEWLSTHEYAHCPH